jgi:ankyrin repeat protein
MTESSIPRQLSESIESGDTGRFRELMIAHPEHVWDRRRPGKTRWLMSAVSSGQLPIVELLASAGADINAPKAVVSAGAPEGVIDTAATEGRLEIACWLLDRGAVINHVVLGTPRCFALSGAAAGGHFEVVKLLVERGAWINSAWAGMTPLSHALTYGNTEVADYLRSVGAKLPEELDLT